MCSSNASETIVVFFNVKLFMHKVNLFYCGHWYPTGHCLIWLHSYIELSLWRLVIFPVQMCLLLAWLLGSSIAETWFCKTKVSLGIYRCSSPFFQQNVYFNASDTQAETAQTLSAFLLGVITDFQILFIRKWGGWAFYGKHWFLCQGL